MKLFHPSPHLLAILASVAVQTAASAATVVLSPSKDNTLYESSTGSLSDGQGGYLYAGETGLNDGYHLRRGLIAFDLSSIPAGAIVSSVTLSLYVSRTSPSPDASTVALHVATKNWGEGLSTGTGAGAPAQAGDATWLHSFYNTSFWDTPGGDFRATASASTDITVEGKRYSWGGGSLSGDVQAWLNNSSTNFGWLIRGVEAVEGIYGTAIRFNSGENTANLPQLTITYTVPEPSATALLAAGAVVGFRRRRSTSHA